MSIVSEKKGTGIDLGKQINTSCPAKLVIDHFN